MCELFMSGFLDYPKLIPGSKSYKINDSLGPYNQIIIRPPHWRYWSIFGRNTVRNVKLNNIGLPGNDINKDFTKCIFVLGSCIIQPVLKSGDSTAIAIFSSQMNKKEVNVINLGAGGNDPYILWHRSVFFSHFYNPDCVIVVIDQASFSFFLNRWQDGLHFEKQYTYPQELPERKLRRISAKPREHSAFINLLANSFLISKNKLTGRAEAMYGHSKSDIPTSNSWNKLESCIEHFSQTYSGKIIFISILPNAEENKVISQLCSKYKSDFYSNGRITQLTNTEFNKELGFLLTKSIINHFRNRESKR